MKANLDLDALEEVFDNMMDYGIPQNIARRMILQIVDIAYTRLSKVLADAQPDALND